MQVFSTLNTCKKFFKIKFNYFIDESLSHTTCECKTSRVIHFFQGAMVKYDLSRPPGNRVVSLHLRCKECRVPKYEPVNHHANYTLLMPDYLAMGGDNFTSFTNNVVKREYTGI